MEIKETEVYTPDEARKILKISSSTVLRLIKQDIINAAKIGKQYRIMGKELLRLISPKFEDRVGKIYGKGRRWLHEEEDQIKDTEAKAVKLKREHPEESVRIEEKTDADRLEK